MVDWNKPSTLEAAIAQKGMSVGAFADHIGLSRSQVYRLIAGDFKPRFDTQRRIEAALQPSVSAKPARKARAA